MAIRFSVWIDNPQSGSGGNIQDYSTYASDSQRINGFQPGVVASSVRMNTALRSATLVTAALMSAIAGDQTFDASTSFATLSSYIASLWLGKAPINSPSFVGTPTAPTPDPDDNSDKLATTAFVQDKFSGSGKRIPLVKTGSYTGTGTYGQTNPNSISEDDLDGQPLMLIFFGPSDHATYWWGNSAFTYGNSTCTVSTTGTPYYTYTATKSMIYGGQVSRYHGASEIFGTSDFYGSNTISAGELVNPVAFIAGPLADLTQYTYVQTKADYEAQSDTMFTFVVDSVNTELLNITERQYMGDNPYYEYAKNGITIDVPSGTTAGWVSTPGTAYEYYLSNIQQIEHWNYGFTWYNTTSAALQLNSLNVTYNWLAIY